MAWVVEETRSCNCGAGPQIDSWFPHEPHCGYEGIGPVEEVVSPSSMFDFSNEPYLAVL